MRLIFYNENKRNHSFTVQLGIVAEELNLAWTAKPNICASKIVSHVTGNFLQVETIFLASYFSFSWKDFVLFQYWSRSRDNHLPELIIVYQSNSSNRLFHRSKQGLQVSIVANIRWGNSSQNKKTMNCNAQSWKIKNWNEHNQKHSHQRVHGFKILSQNISSARYCEFP